MPYDSAIREAISNIEKITNEEWLSSLAPRKRKELEFHDHHRDRSQIELAPQDTYEKLYGNLKYYSATEASNQYLYDWIEKNAKGKVFLDYACGNGGNAIRGGKAGAKLSLGFDISSVSVENARQAAAAAGLSGNTKFFQADAEDTRLPSGSVDVIVCSGMLHHLDLSFALPELRRILAPGGKILAVEALDYNPAIKAYRLMTPSMRTEWEKAHILSLKDVAFARRFFDIGEIKYWHILAIAAPHMKPLAPLLHFLDGILTKIPYLQRMAWIFTFELLKREDE